MELLEIIATIGISAVVSLTVCLVENKVRLKLKKIEINEKHYDNDKRIEENLNNNTRAILEKYLEAAGRYIENPCSPNAETFGEVKGIIYLYAPQSSHNMIEKLHDSFDNYTQVDWAQFCHKKEAAMSLLTQISKAFADFLKDRQNNTTS